MNNICTVLLITYNHVKYIEKAIESVLMQKTKYNYIIHIFDDASTDGTSDIVRKYAKKYPEYDFENNVGYGTKKHIEAIKKFGVTDIHRISFLKNIIGEEECKRISMEREAK